MHVAKKRWRRISLVLIIITNNNNNNNNNNDDGATNKSVLNIESSYYD